MEGTSMDCIVQTPAQHRVSWNRLSSTICSQIPSSSKDGDSKSFLGNLLHCLTTVTAKERKAFPFVWGSCVSVYANWLLSSYYTQTPCFLAQRSVAKGIVSIITVSKDTVFTHKICKHNTYIEFKYGFKYSIHILFTHKIASPVWKITT